MQKTVCVNRNYLVKKPVFYSWLMIAALLAYSLALADTSNCSNPLTVEKPSAVASTSALSGLPAYKTDGQFSTASPEEQEVMRQLYLKNGVTKEITAPLRPADESDFALNLNRMSEKELNKLRKLGSKHAKEQYVFTSGMGAATRLGGAVKAVFPINLTEVESHEEIQQLILAADISNTASLSSLLTLLKQEDLKFSSAEEEQNFFNQKQNQAKEFLLTKIHDQYANDLRAINSIDAFIVSIAINSRGNNYQYSDIGGSTETFKVIKNYLDFLSKNYTKKQFHPNHDINQKIKEALGKYFAESEKRGETHLFAMQHGFYAMQPGTGEAITALPAMGEGAGKVKKYLDASGRTDELIKRGVKYWTFENIEVLSEYSLLAGIHIKENKPLSAVMVPAAPGYNGGHPYMIERNGVWRFELLEDKQVPEDLFKSMNFKWFNTNTMTHDIHLPGPETIGFEPKTSRGIRHIRPKVSLGDITADYEAAIIGARLHHEYENNKDIPDYVKNGAAYISIRQASWAADLER